jgi:hypothetical protein
MTSLDEWYAAQREHLDMGLWLDLALRVARVDAMISAEYFSSAENALPPLYDIPRRYWQPEPRNGCRNQSAGNRRKAARHP